MMQAEDITYDFLKEEGDKSGYTSHIHHFKDLFSAMNRGVMLEFGCGYSTKYFIDNCDKVISVEFETDGTGVEWINACKEMYKDCRNWEGIIYTGSSKFSKACGYQCSVHRDPALRDNTYVTELDLFIKQLTNEHKIDVGFVDASVYIRGDMVELMLQNKIPVVVAHDTNNDDGTQVSLYGWYKIKSTEGYEKIHFPYGAGTTFYISKKLKDLIQRMK